MVEYQPQSSPFKAVISLALLVWRAPALCVGLPRSAAQLYFPHVRALLLLIDDLETADEPHPGLLVGGQIDNMGAIQL
jgi:hypothetical protein